MALRQIQVTVPKDKGAEIFEWAKDLQLANLIFFKGGRGEESDSLFITTRSGSTEPILESLKKRFGFKRPEDRIVTILPAEATIPVVAEQELLDRVTVEELEEQVRRGARLDINYLLLAALSAIVATMGLLGNSTAVVIGAMIIAPFLGPVIATSYGILTADLALLRRGVQGEIAGISTAIALAFVTAWIVPPLGATEEIVQRVYPTVLDLVVAFCSGVAGTLSMTAGLSAIAVGVMIAVSLVPPAAVIGVGIASADWSLIRGPSLLLISNIFAIHLAATLTFMIKKVRVTGWRRQRAAKVTLRWGVITSVATILMLSIPLVQTTWLSIQRRGNERIVRQFLTRHPELGELRRVSDITISGRPRFAVEVYAQEPPSPEILRLVKDDLRQRLGEAPDLTLTVVSARVL
ncbi:MAG: TIGR00341 family protein [Candidatus Methylomirabilis sp.]